MTGWLRPLFGIALLAAACKDPTLVDRAQSLGPDPGPYPEGPNHYAGYPCTWCHMKGSTADPVLDLAGTVYARRGSSEPLAGASVRLFDASGNQVALVTNEVGNFFLLEGKLALEFPLWVKLEHGGKEVAMQTPIHRERSCAGCHAASAGPNSPGPVFLEEPK
jgi:hypothetical protein